MSRAHPSRRPTRVGTPWVGATRPAVALLVFAFSIVAAAAQEPWEFPDLAAKRQVENKYSKYWYENYPAAERIVTSGQGDLDEAITRLRLSIDNNPDSGRARHPVERRNVEYFPYYMLARAFSMKGQPDLAKRCLDREQQLGQIAGSSLAAEFQQLNSRIQLQASLGSLLAQADRVAGWTGGQGGVVLSPPGLERAGRIKTAADALRGASGGASPDLAAMQSGATALIGEMLGLCEDETAALKSRFAVARTAFGAEGGFGAQAWKEAFAGKEQQADLSSCSISRGDSSAAAVEQAQKTVERCSAQVLQAMRTAGSFACAKLEQERTQLEGLAQQQQKVSGKAPTIAPMPAACSTGWSGAGHAELARSLGGLDLQAQHDQFQTEIGQIGGDIERIQADLRAQAEAERARIQALVGRIPEVDRRCVSNLQLDTASRRLSTLRAGAENAGPDFDTQVNTAIDALIAGMEAGVGSLLAERGECEGLDTTNLDALNGAMAAYKSGRDAAKLEALCSTANRASDDIGQCWQSNTSVVREKLLDYRRFLDAAVQARSAGADPALAASSELDCLSATRDGMRPDPPRSNVNAWVQSSRAALADARACLASYRDLRLEGFRGIADRVGRVETMLQSAGADDAGTSALGALGDRLGRVSAEAKALDGRLEGLTTLADPSAAKGGPAELRQRLQSLGLDSTVRADWLTRLETLNAADERYAQTWFGVLDQASGPLVAEARSKLETWERLTSLLGPFLALQQGFAAFEDGDLDGAIHAIRRAQTEQRLPTSGRAAALCHASLSYFLYTKSLTYPGGQDLEAARLLEQDALAEARQAVQAQRDFSLPPSLFAGAKFGEFFKDCCGANGDARR